MTLKTLIGRMIPTKRVSANRAFNLLNDYRGTKFFSVKFRKRTNGKLRNMVALKEVIRSERYDPLEKDLVIIWDLEKESYRSIPKEGIISFKLEGRRYLVV